MNAIDIKQGGVYLADLNPIKGHEQGGYRPVLVIQGNLANNFLNTVIVIPLTSNLNAKYKKGTCFVPKDISGLDFDSVGLIFQIRTIDKRRLNKQISIMPEEKVYSIINDLIELF